jgi:DNA polymerase-3 subunit delta
LFVYGSDDLLVDHRARVLYDAHCENGEIFNCEQKSDIHLSINALCEFLHTVPMFSETNNIWIRGAHFFSGGETEGSKLEVARLLGAIKTCDECVILLSACPVDRRTKLFKEFSQLAECHEVADISDKILDEFIREICCKNGIEISADAAALLKNLIARDTRLLQGELEKLISYIYGDHGTISAADVSELVDASRGGEFFQQIENFYSPSMDEKLDAIGRYFYFTGEARPLIIGLQNRTRLMIQLRALADSNKILLGKSLSKLQLDGVANALNFPTAEKSSHNIFSQNPWYLSKLLGSVRRYSLDKLLHIQLALMAAIADAAREYGGQISLMKELALEF